MLLTIALITAPLAITYLLYLLFNPKPGGRKVWNSDTVGTRNGRPWWKDKEPY